MISKKPVVVQNECIKPDAITLIDIEYIAISGHLCDHRKDDKCKGSFEPVAGVYLSTKGFKDDTKNWLEVRRYVRQAQAALENCR